MQIKLMKLHLENFKCYKEFDADFGDYTKITGANGLGKSTLAAAYMWLFWNIDYNLSSNPNVRRKIDRQPVNDVPVVVEATLDIDGKEVTAKKVQKRTFKKDSSFSDDNTYFINDAPKTLRDFNEYFGFDMDVFKLCSNVNAFLSQNPKEMRKFLFGLVEDVKNLDVAKKFDELSELVPLLEKYTADDLMAMNKASMTKITKEQNGIPAAIAENKRYLVEDVDTSALELQKNALEEKINSIKAQLENSEQARAEWQRKSDDIMELQFKKSDMEKAAMDKIRKEEREIQDKIDAAEYGFNSAIKTHKEAEIEIAALKQVNEKKEQRKQALLDQWHEENQRTFYRENEEFVGLSDEDMICPTCGQPLPEELKAKKLAENEASKKSFYEKKEADRIRFLEDKKNNKGRINEDGRKVMAEIKSNTARIEELQAAIEQAKADKVRFNAEKSEYSSKLNDLPNNPDMSGNQEYEALCMEIQKKEEALRAGDTGANYRTALKGQLEEAEKELTIVKEKLLSVLKNAEFEERIEYLEKQRLILEQKKADCEKVLNLLEQLDEKKNTLLVDEINSHFGKVKWSLFKHAKNGNYLKDYCKPIAVDTERGGDKDYGDDTNTGLEIETKLDIMMSVQKIVNIYCPIFLDFGESIDSWRIPKGESQLIVLCRTDNRELKIEEVA